MEENKFNAQSGKSIIEMLIVLTVIAILITSAVFQLGKSRENLNRQNIARELKILLERARFDSVKRRPTVLTDMSKVVIDSATSFTLHADINQNGTLDATDSRQVSFSSTNVKIVGNNLVLPVTISFNRFGQIIVTNGIGVIINAPPLTVCEDCTYATATPKNANTISISSTGTVAMMHGTETQGSIADPSVTTVDQSTEINSKVTVQNSYSSGSTPIPIPTPTPSITPAPTATPTPTPAPNACTRNQRPTQDNCVCNSPMSVRNTGKCQ